MTVSIIFKGGIKSNGIKIREHEISNVSDIYPENGFYKVITPSEDYFYSFDIIHHIKIEYID